MRKIFILFTSFILIFAQNIPVSAKDIQSKISQIIAFGDSYSDNGEAKRISTEIVNSSSKPDEAYIKPSDNIYWNNRYSNGKTAVEVFAENLNLPLKNYAVGGATTGFYNYSNWMDCLGNTGVLAQIGNFKESLNGKPVDKDALYFIFASANDYFKYADNPTGYKVEAIADEAVDNLKSAVRNLTKLGAKNFFVVNSSDLSLVPYEIIMKRTEDASKFTQYMNNKLPKSMKELEQTLNIAITVFDMVEISNEILKNKTEFGISITDRACQQTYPNIKPSNSNSDSYYFWDEWHYTSAVHKIIGQKMSEKF